VRPNCSANTGDRLLPPRVARVRHVGHYRHDRQAVAVPAENVFEQRVVFAEPREIYEQLLGCRAFGRIADVDDDQTGTLDTLESLRDRPVFNAPGRWSTANLRDTGQHPGTDALHPTRILADKSPTGRPMTSSIHVDIPSGRRRSSSHASALARCDAATSCCRRMSGLSASRVMPSNKHCHVKLYLKEGRALRIETVINDADDLDILKCLAHLPQVQRAARQINARVLTMLRVGHSCAIENALFAGVCRPYARDGQRTGALRFGDVRVMGLAGALCLTVHAVAGFNNRSLRALVAGLLGTTYTTSQMTYDLRRLRLHGLIRRLPRSNTFLLTPEGMRVALFYTKVHDRLLTPLLAADKPPAPLPLRRALHILDQSVDSYIDHALLRHAG
jgi:hypothetical protein